MGPIRAILVVALGIAAVLAAGAGSALDGQAGRRRLGGQSKHVTRVTLRDSAYGKVLFDQTGQALYLFTADAARRSNCSGECAAAWPPFHARGRLAAGAGVNRKRLGSIKSAATEPGRSHTLGTRSTSTCTTRRTRSCVTTSPSSAATGWWSALRASRHLERPRAARTDRALVCGHPRGAPPGGRRSSSPRRESRTTRSPWKRRRRRIWNARVRVGGRT